MPTTYTVIQQGRRWVASDGVRHAEGDEPSEALDNLTLAISDPELAESVADARSADDLEDAICKQAVVLIKMVTLRVPPVVLRETAKIISRMVDEFAEQIE